MTGSTSDAIPLCVPEIGAKELAYLQETLESGWVAGGGPFVGRFETQLARILGVPSVLAVSSGTSALHLALHGVGVQPDEEVLISASTFIAPANAIRYLGAWPVPVDVEARHGLMDLDGLGSLLRSDYEYRDRGWFNRRTGRRARALLPVHTLGHAVDMAAVLTVAREFGLEVVEDAAQSLGSRSRGGAAGTFGDVGCFSFNGNKVVTCGGGGALVARDAKALARLRHLSAQAKSEPVEYVHDEVGFNYRLSSLQAAVGCAQLESLDRHLEHKRKSAARYAERLAGLPGVTPLPEPPDSRSSWWLFTIRIDPVRFGRTSRDLLQSLAARGIETRPLWQPLHLGPACRGSWTPPCPVAERLHRECLCLPSSCGLTEAQQDRVIRALGEIHESGE